MLWLYRRVIFGELTREDLKSILDLDRREIAIFAPLVAGVLVMGVWPGPFLRVMHASVANLIGQTVVPVDAAMLSLP
jgi:NADH-quinone oxidoreductase subunit M